MTKEKLIERLKSKAWVSHPRGTKDALYLDDAIDLIEELFEQNCIKHVVSGSDPLYQLAKEIGFENVSEDDLKKVIDKTKGLRSASGAVDKTVRKVCNHESFFETKNGYHCKKCHFEWERAYP